MSLQQVQRIACSNAAGFVMRFSIQALNLDGGTISTVGDSGDYPIDQTRVLDLSMLGISEGTPVRPLVHAEWGATNEGNRYVAYSPNNQTATFNVTGTTLNYDVQQVGA